LRKGWEQEPCNQKEKTNKNKNKSRENIDIIRVVHVEVFKNGAVGLRREKGWPWLRG